MSYSPTHALDLECGFTTLIGGLKGMSALVGASRTIEANPEELSAMLDLLVMHAQRVQQLSGLTSNC